MQRTGLIVLATMIATGCGETESQPRIGGVHGKVTIKGKAAPSGVIINFTTEGSTGAFVAVVGENGQYKYEPSSTVPHGTYGVSLENPPTPTKEVDGLTINDPDAKVIEVVPEKYQQKSTSGLSVELGATDVEFDIAIP